ncbi:hypothetical protein FRC07_000420 [Ceratobasidium sp. 392]|nr:hypothetical protein FRC07_000420 [Ceratobasidium sp. 392]
MSTYDAQPKVHALHIPELLNLIRESIDHNDWVNLMKTCRTIFSIIASSIWSEVEAQVLMDLIVESPRPTISQSEGSDDTADSIIDFSRFDVYAPFVRQLRVYGRTARYFKGERRQVCVSRAQKELLLPHLASIALMTTDLYHDSDALYWLDLFLTPSLRELRVTPITKSYTAYVSYPATYALLDKLVTTCSTIERLEFYPIDIRRRAGRHPDNSTNMLWPTTTRPDFSSFTQLRRITSSIGILDQGGLAALGALPRLQFLLIRGCDESPEGLQLEVPDDSFPALTQLTLLDVDTTNLPAIMQVKPLVQGLASLRLSQAFSLSESDFQYCERWLSQTIPRLLEYTLRLKKFTYSAVRTFGSLPGRYPVYRIDHIPLLQTLSNIPLQHVSLTGLCFMDEGFLPLLPSAFASTNVLQIPSQAVHSNSLSWFAKIPHLRHLLLAEISLGELPHSWPSFQNSLETLECIVNHPAFGPLVEPDRAAR